MGLEVVVIGDQERTNLLPLRLPPDLALYRFGDRPQRRVIVAAQYLLQLVQLCYAIGFELCIAETKGRGGCGPSIGEGRNIGLWLGLALIFSAIPTLVLQYVILSPPTGGGDLTDPNLLADPSFLWKYYVGTFAGILISLVLSSLLSSSLIRATIEDMSGRTPSIGDCIKTALAVLLPTIGVGLVAGIAVMIGLALLIVPGIILWLRWSVSVPVLVQERQGVLGSMGRSAALTSGSRWSLFGLFLILVIASIAIQWLVGMVVPTLGTWLSLIIAALVQSLLSTLFSTATAVSYAELRQVKEGTSVNELAEIFA